jgi:hypothetical protein
MMMNPSLHSSSTSTVGVKNPSPSKSPHHHHHPLDNDHNADNEDVFDPDHLHHHQRPMRRHQPAAAGRFSMYLAHLASRDHNDNDDDVEIAGRGGRNGGGGDHSAASSNTYTRTNSSGRNSGSNGSNNNNNNNNNNKANNALLSREKKPPALQSSSHRRSSQGALQFLYFFPNFGMYAVLAFFMIGCVFYIVIVTFTPLGALSQDCGCQDGLTWCICARPTINALTRAQLACLAVSRVAAYLLYPLYLVLFLTMARNLRAYLQFTIVSEYVPLTSLHHLHVRAGMWVGIGVTIHSIFHLIRWGLQGKLSDFLLHSQTGRTGVVGLILTPLIVGPMRLGRLRQAVSFEVRKRLHYLSWLWALALCAHAPQEHVAYIVGTAFAIYVVDWCYGMLAATHAVPSARFVRLESSVMIRFRKPTGFTMKGSSGYCYLCIPWVSKVEWHAFSAFVDPIDANYYCFCIAVAGDWTQKLHDKVSEPIYRRLWICGPFPSPFEHASDNDHVISIASGIGITPALSAIHALADHRRMHLVWICRDASLVEFVMDYGGRFDDDAYSLIYYTGERELVFRSQEMPPNVFLLQGRPDLEKLIPSIIRASKHDVLPDLFDLATGFGGKNNKNNVNITNRPAPVQNRVISASEASMITLDDEHSFYAETARLLQSYSPDELFNAAVRRSNVRNGRRVVSVEGWRDLMDSFFTRKFTDEQVEYMFRQLNMDDRGGYIDSKQFHKSLQLMQGEVKRHRRPSVLPHAPMGPSPAAFAAAEAMEVDDPSLLSQLVDHKDHWRLMYCGGSPQVVATLETISNEHLIPLSVESFEW